MTLCKTKHQLLLFPSVLLQKSSLRRWLVRAAKSLSHCFRLAWSKLAQLLPLAIYLILDTCNYLQQRILALMFHSWLYGLFFLPSTCRMCDCSINCKIIFESSIRRRFRRLNYCSTVMSTLRSYVVHAQGMGSSLAFSPPNSRKKFIIKLKETTAVHVTRLGKMERKGKGNPRHKASKKVFVHCWAFSKVSRFFNTVTY